ncbi:MAG: hypothetical protein H7A23_02275 [Leptospiraceae bacterium]|nr:hypothetical protein [Leptospiraceae bacterium]MCP5493357.1 hypothetical protein [Leptospiraceae bacterium]
MESEKTNSLLVLELNSYIEELKKAKETAELANKAKSEFFISMNHELRSPLNAILGFTQIMSRSKDFPEHHRKNLEKISQSGEYLLSLIDQVISLVKVDINKISLEESSFSIIKLLEELKNTYKFKAKKKDLEFLWEQKSDLPKYIFSDRPKLKQIIINLLENAIKFTEKGSITVFVSWEKAEKDLFLLHFKIQDTGVGIDTSKIDDLFNPFSATKLENKNMDYPRLGLPISYNFAKLLGGQVQVQSKLNKGSIFSFWIQTKLPSETKPEDNNLFPIGIEHEKGITGIESFDKEDIKMLPKELLQRFTHAIKMGDLELIEEINVEITRLNSNIGNHFTKLAEDYELDHLVELVKNS